MTLLLISFIAGVLTVLAPCILPLLPVIVGGSVSEGKSGKYKPFIVTGSLAVSVILFTLLLKVTLLFITVPPAFWSWLSGIILLFFAFTLLAPNLWARLTHKFAFSTKSNIWLGKASKKNGVWGDVLLGAALGPVFSSCSPTYFVIIGTVIPQSISVGLINLLAYVLGLSLVLLGVALLGKKFLSRVTSLSDPQGWFKKTLGVLFLVIAIFIITGTDKKLETWLLDRGLVPAVDFEQQLLERVEM